jgi:MoaA/NifB/PqqE/SkfB family radical SAM enzyme
MTSPETIYLHLTGACNLKCQYCYLPAGEIWENEMDTQKVIDVLEDAALLGAKKLVFTGGEPLLRDDLRMLATYFKSSDNHRTMRLSLNSNGILISPQNASWLVELFDEIRISIDGFPEYNDVIRGSGAFAGAMAACQDIIAAGGSPYVFITVTALNLPGLDEFLAYLLYEGICRIHLSPIRLTGRASGKHGWGCSSEEITRVAKKFWREYVGLELIEPSKTENFNCGLGRYITIYPDGSLYPCHLLAFPEFRAGNIGQESLYSLFHRSELLNKIRELDFCRLAMQDKDFQKLIKNDASVCVGQFLEENQIRRKFREKIAC